MVIRRDYVIPRLVELFKALEDVEVAVLFGSLARDGFTSHDIDVAVKLSRGGGLLDLGLVVSRIAEALGVGVDAIDVVDLDRASPTLLFKILSEGIVVKGGEKALKKLAEKASLHPDALTELKIWGTLNPDPKLDEAIIASRVDEIRRNIRFLRERILGRDPEDLDYGEKLALERALHRVIEAMLDICRHVVSVYSLGLVESYGDYPRKLAQANLMPRDLAQELTKLAGLRNILVHRYLEVDIGMLHKAAREITDRIAEEFIKWVEKLHSHRNP